MLRPVKRAVALLLFFLITACREEPRDLTYREQIEQWQQKRAAGLKKEDGWLSLVGLVWLNPGDNKLVMPGKTPVTVGTLTLSDGKVTLTPDPAARLTIDGKPVAAPVELKNDASDDGPTVVSSGTMRFYAIKRGGDRYGIRVKDSQAETRIHFRGLEYYPIDEKWRVVARFEPYNPVKKIPITDITGATSEEPSPGALVFTVDGKEYRLDPILEGKDDLFIILKDETSQDTTYPAGRYLYSKLPGPDQRVVVDFNKAYNPPCTFTPFATCPLPPLQNRLPFRIEAGEKRYGH